MATPSSARSPPENETSFETRSAESDSSSYTDLNHTNDQGRSKDNNGKIYSVHTYHPCLGLDSCVEAKAPQARIGSKKRKSPAVSTPVSTKKLKLNDYTDSRFQSSSSWQLPTEVWQHIFTFLPPKMLGRLLSVNKHFNSLLSPLSDSSCDTGLSLVTSSLPILRPEVIWQLSRRRFWPTMPAPLRGHTELQMWQLACQSECQFHSRADQLLSSINSPSNSGHKHTATRPIWSFSLRSCVSCLAERTIKVCFFLYLT